MVRGGRGGHIKTLDRANGGRRCVPRGVQVAKVEPNWMIFIENLEAPILNSFNKNHLKIFLFLLFGKDIVFFFLRYC